MILAISFEDYPDLIVDINDIGSYWRQIPPHVKVVSLCYSAHQSVQHVESFDEAEGVRVESGCLGYVVLRKRVITHIGAAAKNVIGLGWSSDGENVCLNWYDEATGEGIEKERRSVNGCGIGWRRNPT